MAMSNINNKQEVKKQPRAKSRQTKANHLNEEFGAEANFDANDFKKEREFSTDDKPVSERTAWN